jgi:uncharacterized membrane protein YhaH (DUF805 family)
MGLLEFKKRAGPTHKFFIPAITSAFWIFIVIPYGCIVPVLSIAIKNTDAIFKDFVKGIIGASGLLLILSVSSFAIIFNILLQVKRIKLCQF